MSEPTVNDAPRVIAESNLLIEYDEANSKWLVASADGKNLIEITSIQLKDDTDLDSPTFLEMEWFSLRGEGNEDLLTQFSSIILRTMESIYQQELAAEIEKDKQVSEGDLYVDR